MLNDTSYHPANGVEAGSYSKMEGLMSSTVLYKCPYCSKGFCGKYDFDLAVKHITEKHSKRGTRGTKERVDNNGGHYAYGVFEPRNHRISDEATL